MNAFTWAWIAAGALVAGIEGVALFNSRRGDTLSEHVWAWLGVGRYRTRARCAECGLWLKSYGRLWVHEDSTNMQPAVHLAVPAVATPKWTLRVARLALITFLVWLALHLVTGGWV